MESSSESNRKIVEQFDPLITVTFNLSGVRDQHYKRAIRNSIYNFSM